MRIGHWQLESKCGDFEGNLAKVVTGLERAQRERVFFADVDPAVTDKTWKVGRSLWSLRELHKQLLEAAGIATMG